MAASNPLNSAYPVIPLPVSRKIYCIAGLLTTVYGLEELRSDVRDVSCLWLHHPRLHDQTCMEPIACSAINAWNDHCRQTKLTACGLIAISIDQRNHGSRVIDPVANRDWRTGNERHAQDMFSIYHGTVVDTSQVLTMLAAYIFPMTEHIILTNIVCGISLGGHSAWQCLMNDPRFTAGIVVIGCPDITRLMADRATRSKLSTAGSRFVGSKDFPVSLAEAVQRYDPAAQFVGVDVSREDRFSKLSTLEEREAMVSLMSRTLRGKRILKLSGGADKLVPYDASAPFLDWLKEAISPNGIFKDGNVWLEDNVYEGVGHVLTADMAKRIESFIVETMQQTCISEDAKSRL